MRQAIKLAQKHQGLTGENPSVGAIITKQIDGKHVIIGQGVTALNGRPHAETIALDEAGELAKGATAYVTLEPCAHYGKTPPCAHALVKAGIIRLICACDDPDPRVAGRGFDILRAANIDLTTGFMAEQAEIGLAAYFKWKTKKRPFVTLKMALSHDDKIGKNNGDQIKITGEEASKEVHLKRAQSDAILIGSNTALNDDPILTCRLPDMEQYSPIRIVLDRNHKLPNDSRLVQTKDQAPLWIMTHETLSQVMDDITDKGVKTLLVEGGAIIAKAFLDTGLVDEILLFKSNKVTIQDGVDAPITPSSMPEQYRLIEARPIDEDELYHYRKI